MQFPLILMSALLVVTGPPPSSSAGQSLRVDCQIVPINDILVPAQEAGLLTELDHALQGAEVKRDQVLGRIDDKHALLQVEVQEKKLEAAQMEADNETNIIYAGKAREVALLEWQRNRDVNSKVPGTVPDAEMQRAKLQYYRADAEVNQATMNKSIAVAQAAVSASELKAANESLDRRIIKAEYNAQVERIYLRQGEWVKPGDPVMRLVQMDRLWAEALVDATRFTPRDLANRSVTVTVKIPGHPQPFVAKGEVVYVSDQIDGDLFELKVEVANRREFEPNGRWLLQAGRSGTIDITP